MDAATARVALRKQQDIEQLAVNKARLAQRYREQIAEANNNKSAVEELRKQRKKERDALFKKLNKEKAKEYAAKYRIANKDRIAQRDKSYRDKYRAANKERIAEAAKGYYKRNRDRLLEGMRAWRAANADTHKAKVREYESLESTKERHAVLRREVILNLSDSYVRGQIVDSFIRVGIECKHSDISLEIVEAKRLCILAKRTKKALKESIDTSSQSIN